MHLRSLELVGWRSYEHATMEFGPGAHLLTGANGAGKTNLLEAVHYLAVGRSHRVNDDHVLVHTDRQEAILRADVASAGRSHRVELALRPGGRSRARVDGAHVPRVADAFGHVRTVLFAPEDLVLVRGDPADRRRFLDDLLAQRRPAYRAARQDYDRVLRQRNALLKQLRGRTDSDHALTAWTEELVRLGARIVAARLMACAALANPTAARYADVAGRENAASIALVLERSTGVCQTDDGAASPDLGGLAEELRGAIAQRGDEERERGLSLVGPHRDELRLELNGVPARTHGSQGEAWSLALALRLASRELLREVGDDPVVLLDDVFAQLDTDRRRRLAEWCGECEQLLVTTAVAEDVPLPSRRAIVAAGELRPATDTGGRR